MSYCRFSTDDFHCDFYAFESKSGYELYIAGHRVEWTPPTSPISLEALNLPSAEWTTLLQDYFDQLSQTPRVAIDHQAAGDHRIFPSLPEMRDTIAQLLSEGFRAPDWLLPELDAEISQDAAAAQPSPTQPPTHTA